MDPERVPVRPQANPVHGLSQDTQVDPFNPSYSNVRQTTARIDTSNFSPSAGNVLSSTSGDDEKSSPLSVHRPESNSGRRETRMNDDNRLSNEATQMRSGIDWIVPTESKRHTAGERLQPTLDIAIVEKDKYAAKAKWTGYALNAAIGMQVLLGSLTTGLSALSVAGGASIAKTTTALGALATLVASYLARARGSNEPELSITRTKDLEQFIRECRSFQLDHGHTLGPQFDDQLIGFRRRFEELLGNANGERKLSPPV